MKKTIAYRWYKLKLRFYMLVFSIFVMRGDIMAPIPKWASSLFQFLFNNEIKKTNKN